MRFELFQHEIYIGPRRHEDNTHAQSMAMIAMLHHSLQNEHKRPERPDLHTVLDSWGKDVIKAIAMRHGPVRNAVSAPVPAVPDTALRVIHPGEHFRRALSYLVGECNETVHRAEALALVRRWADHACDAEEKTQRIDDAPREIHQIGIPADVVALLDGLIRTYNEQLKPRDEIANEWSRWAARARQALQESDNLPEMPTVGKNSFADAVLTEVRDVIDWLAKDRVTAIARELIRPRDQWPTGWQRELNEYGLEHSKLVMNEEFIEQPPLERLIDTYIPAHFGQFVIKLLEYYKAHRPKRNGERFGQRSWRDGTPIPEPGGTGGAGSAHNPQIITRGDDGAGS